MIILETLAHCSKSHFHFNIRNHERSHNGSGEIELEQTNRAPRYPVMRSKKFKKLTDHLKKQLLLQFFKKEIFSPDHYRPISVTS